MKTNNRIETLKLKEDINGIKWWHRIQLKDGNFTPGFVNYGIDGGNWPTTRFGLPTNMNNLSVIDIGGWDGFFSFEAEKRGAKKIILTDCLPEEGGNLVGTKGFNYAKQNLNSSVIFKQLDITNEIETKKFDKYDIVMCFGVLYHVKSPLIVIENLSSITKGICLLETTIDTSDLNALIYKPGFDGDPTNYFYPTVTWIEEASKQSGFSQFEIIYKDELRATFKLSK